MASQHLDFLAQADPAQELYNQGKTQFDNNQLEEAIATWQKAAELYNQKQDIQGEALALGNKRSPLIRVNIPRRVNTISRV